MDKSKVRKGMIVGYEMCTLGIIWGQSGFEQYIVQSRKTIRDCIAEDDLIVDNSSFTAYSSSIVNHYMSNDTEIFCGICIGHCIKNAQMMQRVSNNLMAYKQFYNCASSALDPISEEVFENKKEIVEFIISSGAEHPTKIMEMVLNKAKINIIEEHLFDKGLFLGSKMATESVISGTYYDNGSVRKEIMQLIPSGIVNSQESDRGVFLSSIMNYFYQHNIAMYYSIKIGYAIQYGILYKSTHNEELLDIVKHTIADLPEEEIISPQDFLKCIMESGDTLFVIKEEVKKYIKAVHQVDLKKSESNQIDDKESSKESILLSLIYDEMISLKEDMHQVKEEQNQFKEDLHQAKEEILSSIGDLADSIVDLKDICNNIRTKQTELEEISLTEENLQSFVDEVSEMIVAKCANENLKADKNGYKNVRDCIENELGSSAVQKMNEESIDNIISAVIMYSALENEASQAEYSGVCICVMKALEIELRKRFYNEYIDYIKKNNNIDGNVNYPSALLKNSKLLRENECTFGAILNIMGHPFNTKKSTEKRTKENLMSVLKYCCEELFVEKISTDNVSDKLSDLRTTLDNYRKYYRNPAAHTGTINQETAKECLNQVLWRNHFLKNFLENCNS